MDANDARYENACRVMLVVAAGVHWATASIYVRQEILLGVEPSDVYAWVGALLASIA